MMPNLEGVPLCRVFLTQHGNCKYGSTCKYSHGTAPVPGAGGGTSMEGPSQQQQQQQQPPGHSPSKPISRARKVGDGGDKEKEKDKEEGCSSRSTLLGALRSGEAVQRAKRSKGGKGGNGGGSATKIERARSSSSSDTTYGDNGRFDSSDLTFLEKLDAAADDKIKKSPKPKAACMFVGTAEGCKYGFKCRFAHDN